MDPGSGRIVPPRLGSTLPPVCRPRRSSDGAFSYIGRAFGEFPNLRVDRTLADDRKFCTGAEQ